MKKNKILIITSIVLSLLVPALFTSCFDPIYSVIRTDVKPEKPTVSGNITSIARYKAGNSEFLVLAANGGLRYKKTGNNKHGQWQTYSNLPFELVHNDFETGSYLGEQILKVVADTNNLYLITIQYKSSTPSPENAKIWTIQMNEDWTSSKHEWKEVPLGDIKLPIEYLSSGAKFIFNIFYTNDPNPDYRKAYLRVGHPDATADENKAVKYYELNGANQPKEVTSTVKSADEANDKSEKVINSAVYFKGDVKFFNAPASITNGTASNPATYIYYGNNNDLYYSTDGSKFTKGLSVGSYIGSMAITSDSIIFGCGHPLKGDTGGIKRTTLNGGVPGSSTVPFDNNASSQMPSYYKITCLLNETPEKTERESAIYSTVTFPGVPTSGNSKNEDKGLWSYYPERDNWNRE